MEAGSSSRQLSQDVQERYNAVVADPQLFMESLQRFHDTMGTRFLVPVIGRRDLNLHGLFVEVTQRGGIDKVVRERRLKEVARVLDFPLSTTNVSFMLRKYYNMLLANFEQVYFFGAAIGELISAVVTEEPAPIHALPEPEASSSSSSLKGSTVVGIIDDVINDGYVVTLNVGHEKLKGVVLRQGQPTGQLSEHSGRDSRQQQQQHQKRPKVRKSVAAGSKFSRSGYNLFFKEQSTKLRSLYWGKKKELGEAVDALWSNLPEAEKAVYEEKGLKLENIYRSEMKEHKEKLRSRMMDILAETKSSSKEPALLDAAPGVEQGPDVYVNPSGGDSPQDMRSS